MADDWSGHRLDGRDGSGVGKVVAVVGEGDERRWLVVRTGRVGRVTAVPGGDAIEGVGCVWVPYAREEIRQAPKVDAGERLDDDAERGLRDHYGIG